VSGEQVVLRPFRGAPDIPGMTALCNARTRREGQGEYLAPATMAEQYAHLTRCDPARDIRVAERSGAVVGYARTTWDDTGEGHRDHWLITEADPACPGLDTALLDWCERRALEVAAVEVAPRRRLTATAMVGSERHTVLVGRGFQPLRYGHMMIRPHLRDVPAGELPAGVEIRPVTCEQLRAIFEADAAAFRDHWGNVEPTEEDFARFVEDAASGTGSSLWQVAWSGDEVVGQVRTFANEGEREMFGRHRAWTEHISTARAWRERGIATALVCASLRQLAAAGYEEAALGVDSENRSGALGLYESLGYAVVATDVMVQRQIPDALPPIPS
jgi:ribosomal protein S18 acetylase RimI-like enzyme